MTWLLPRRIPPRMRIHFREYCLPAISIFKFCFQVNDIDHQQNEQWHEKHNERVKHGAFCILKKNLAKYWQVLSMICIFDYYLDIIETIWKPELVVWARCWAYLLIGRRLQSSGSCPLILTTRLYISVRRLRVPVPWNTGGSFSVGVADKLPIGSNLLPISHLK